MRIALLAILAAACAKPSRCEHLVGSLAELEKLTGLALELQSGYEAKHGCYQYVGRKGTVGKLVVNLETQRDGYERLLARYPDRERVTVGDATLLVGGEQHVVLLRDGAWTIHALLDRDVFTVDAAKAYVEGVNRRAR